MKITRTFTILLLILCAQPLEAQKNKLQTFFDPVVNSWTVESTVNQKSKLFATMETNGNLHVYDLHHRKLVYYITNKDQSISEGWTTQYANYFIRFDSSGSRLGIFTTQKGFRLYDTETWEVLLELNWREVTQSNLGEVPEPSNITFFGNFLFLQFSPSSSSEADNTNFIFDIEAGKMVGMRGKSGFYCYEPELLTINGSPHISLTDVRAPKHPWELDIRWKGKPIRQAQAVKKGHNFKLSESGLSKIGPDDSFDEIYGEEEEKEIKGPTMPKVDSIIANDLKEEIISNQEWRLLFGKNEVYAETVKLIREWELIPLTTDTLGKFVIDEYSIPGTPYSILKMHEPGGSYHQKVLQYTGGKRRYGNAVFIHPVYYRFARIQEQWRILRPGVEGLEIVDTFTDQKPFSSSESFLDGIIESPSGKAIVFPIDAPNGVRFYSLDLVTGAVAQFATLPRKKLNSWWLREDFNELSVYRFMGPDYFFIQGKALYLDNQLFETRHWTKLLNIPVAGTAESGSSDEAVESIFIVNDTILLGDRISWRYRDNEFNYKIPNKDFYNDNDNWWPSASGYRELNKNYLKRVRVSFSDSENRIYLGDSSQYISIQKDANNRMIWTHHKMQLSLQYYPHFSVLNVNDLDSSDQLLNPNPNYFADANLGANIRLKAGNGKKVMLVSPFGPSEGNIKGSFSADNKYVFTISGHHYIDIWKAYDGSYLATVIPIGNNFIIVDRNQHFYTPDPALLKGLYVRYNGRVYPAEELDIYLHRPDLILEALDFINNPQLLRFYRSWVRERQAQVRDASLDTRRPVVTIVTDSLPLATDRSFQKLNFNIAGLSGRGKAIAWINNIRIDSVELTDAVNSQFPVQLQRGNNKIQVAVVNEQGIFSLRETIYINYVPAKNEGAMAVGIAVGVSEYADKNNNLQFAVKDAKDLASALQSRFESKIALLVDNQITRESLDSASTELSSTSVEDLAIVYLAGHGALDSVGRFYFCTSETDLSNPSVKGIPMTQLRSLFANLKSRKRLLIIDACHSGNAAMLQWKESSVQINDSTTFKQRGFRTNKKAEAASVSARNYSEILRQQLSDVTMESGVMVFSATSGDGVAYESSSWNNGIFTSMLIAALKGNDVDTNNDRLLTLKEIVDHVIEKVKEKTGGRQVPESGVITWDKNWVFYYF